MRTTSIEAAGYMRKSGKGLWKRKQALHFLGKFGPCTAGELGRSSGVTGLWKRLSELRNAGYVRELGKRPCLVTGRRCIVWDVTGKKGVLE